MEVDPILSPHIMKFIIECEDFPCVSDLRFFIKSLWLHGVMYGLLMMVGLVGCA
jgi:hypothetical protein